MKKLVLMVVAIAAVSFASCGGNKAADAAKATEAETQQVAEVDTTAAEAQVAEADTTATKGEQAVEGEQAKTEAEAK